MLEFASSLQPTSSFSKNLKAFENVIEDYIYNNIGDDLNSLPALPMYYLQRNVSLEKIGTGEEDSDDFVTLIKRKMLSDYQDLFGQLELQIANSLRKIPCNLT